MKRLIVIGVVAVFASACGGSGATSTTVPSPATTTVAETAASTSTTSSTSSTSTTPSTTTTQPATTTTVPTEALIQQAVQDYYVAYEACGQSPSQCDPTSFTAIQGPSRSIVTELATGMAAQGLHFSPDSSSSYLVVESVTTTSDTEAIATYCAHDGLVVLGPNGPDGLPTVVNDTVEDFRYQYRLFFEGGRWRVGEQHELERLDGGTACPPAA